MKIQRNDLMRLEWQENPRSQKNRGGYKLNPTRKSATAREMMNQLSLLERRCFLETMMIIMKQLPNTVVIVKIQAKIMNKVEDIFLYVSRSLLAAKAVARDLPGYRTNLQIKNNWSLIKQFQFVVSKPPFIAVSQIFFGPLWLAEQ